MLAVSAAARGVSWVPVWVYERLTEEEDREAHLRRACGGKPGEIEREVPRAPGVKASEVSTRVSRGRERSSRGPETDKTSLEDRDQGNSSED